MVYINFGKKHPNSFLGLDILYRNRQAIGRDTISSILSHLNSEFKLTDKAKALKTYLDPTAEKGKHFVDFKAKTPDGIDFNLSSLKGKYILLSFWSAGCVPCRIENQKISKNYSSLKDKISIISFSIDEKKQNWIKASKIDNILWTNVSDLEGVTGKIKTRYDVQAIPTSFLINKEGIIIERYLGFSDDFLEQLERQIKD